MSDAFVGEIRIFSGNYAPENWHLCDGTVLQLSAYQTLFAVIGTTYGGNGVSTFALPDFRGRLPVGQGSGANLTPRTAGQSFGVEQVQLAAAAIPNHNHPFVVTSVQAITPTPGPSVLLASTAGENAQSDNSVKPPTTTPFINFQTYSDVPSGGLTPLAAQAVGGMGQSMPHNNMMPFQTLSFIIALIGNFPPHS